MRFSKQSNYPKPDCPPAVGHVTAAIRSAAIIWGGESLVGNYRDFHRAAHLRYVAMPGGDQAIHEPWRMSVAYLADARLDQTILKELATASAIRIVEQMIARRFNAPLTSSMGRLFGGVAALAGVRSRVSSESPAQVLGPVSRALSRADFESGRESPRRTYDRGRHSSSSPPNASFPGPADECP